MAVAIRQLSAVTPRLSEEMLSATVTLAYSSALMGELVLALLKQKHIAQLPIAGHTKRIPTAERKNVL